MALGPLCYCICCCLFLGPPCRSRCGWCPPVVHVSPIMVPPQQAFPNHLFQSTQPQQRSQLSVLLSRPPGNVLVYCPSFLYRSVNTRRAETCLSCLQLRFQNWAWHRVRHSINVWEVNKWMNNLWPSRSEVGKKKLVEGWVSRKWFMGEVSLKGVL